MKNIVRKILVLLVIFAVIVGIYIFFHRDDNSEETIHMKDATLPTVHMIYDDYEVNLLHGYVKEMDSSYMRESFTPMNDDRKVKLVVNTYGNKVKEISYQVRSVDGERLVEETTVDSFKSDGDNIHVTLQITNMIDVDTEYNLILLVKTESGRLVRYYTRIQVVTDSYCTEQMKFVKNFSRKTMDEEEYQDILAYLEPSDTQDNSNLGDVNISSSTTQITWGNLEVERVSEPELTIKELIGGIGCYQLQYKVKAKNDYDVVQYYNITEFFRVNWADNRKYLLNFDREMNQIFEPSGQTITQTRINTGIDSDLDLEYMASDSTSYIAFVKERNLFCFDEKNNEITSIYTFADKEKDGVREEYDQHRIRVINVSDEGDVDFLVFGYMNRGEHEGTTGLMICRYHHDTNKIEDIAYIASDKPYGILKETIGKLCHINKEEQMYIFMDNTLYSIDLQGDEYSEVVSGLTDGCYVMNDDATVIAWQEDNSLNDASTIHVLDILTGKDILINAPQGERIRILGFVQEDFVYGLAKADDIYQDKNGNVTFPMYQIKIVDNNLEEIMNYPSADAGKIYVTDAEFEGALISLTRMKKRDGNFVNTSDDQIRNNTIEEEDNVNTSTIVTDLKQTELVLNYAYKMTATSALKIKYPKEILYDNENQLDLKKKEQTDSKYYVYGKGRVQKAYHQLTKAITLADENAGVVVNAQGKTIWERTGRSDMPYVDGIQLTPVYKESQQVAACVDAILRKNGVSINVNKLMKNGATTLSLYEEYLEGRQLNLTGCSLTQVLYYVQNGQAVLGMLDNDRCVLIIGYDLYNAEMIDPTTGESYKMGLEETEEMFEEAGNRFISLLPGE